MPSLLVRGNGFGIGIDLSQVRRRRRRDDRAADPSLRPIPDWLLLLTVALFAAAGSGFTWWLWTITTVDPRSTASVRIDVVRIGISAVVGASGAFALLLAFRQPRSTEISALKTIKDAHERRVTELYTMAAAQLGSDTAPVRLAGLYALERLVLHNPGQRQTIVNVISAYLQMPYTPPEAGAPPEEGTASEKGAQEDRVRTAAQRILHRHLWKTAAEQLRWQGSVDLSGACLVRVRLTMVSLFAADLSKADLTEARLGETDLTRANLTEAKLNGASLCRADLTGADLAEADLTGADLRFAVLDGADLSSATGLTQDQVDRAVGDWKTRLPSHLHSPDYWRTSRSSWARRRGRGRPAVVSDREAGPVKGVV
jgi:Pentapeptide repeats (8 copies)